MDIPSLPTDSVYKFLAVGALVLSLACWYGSYVMLDKNSEELASAANATMSSPSRLELFMKNQPKMSDLPTRALEIVNDLMDRYRFRSRIAKVLMWYGAFLQLVFFFAIYKWYRMQRLNDWMAAFELAERAKNHGIEVKFTVPTNWKV